MIWSTCRIMSSTNIPRQPFKTLFPTAIDDCLDLLSKMFTYHPKARISDSKYWSIGPPPTKPALLPRPPPKREPANPKVSDLNPHDGPVVLSPPRKSRRVMPHREGFEANVHPEKMDDHGHEIPKAAGERSEQVPMSLNFSVFGTKPPTRPTINRY